MASTQDELRDLQLRMNAVTDESLESTRRMRAMAEESREVGAKTLVMLDQQGEQLNGIERGLEQMNQDMYAAEKNLEGMEKCCGLCILPWKRSKAVKASTKYEKAWTDDKKKAEQPATSQPKVQTPAKDVPDSAGIYVQRITNDAREDEMENNLSEVSAIVGNLHHMALDMERELNKQNKQIDKMITKGDVLDSRVTEATRRTNVLLVK